MTLTLRVSRKRLTTILHWTKPLHQYHDTDFESFLETGEFQKVKDNILQVERLTLTLNPKP
jgi:hypothetical protein